MRSPNRAWNQAQCNCCLKNPSPQSETQKYSIVALKFRIRMEIEIDRRLREALNLFRTLQSRYSSSKATILRIPCLVHSDCCGRQRVALQQHTRIWRADPNPQHTRKYLQDAEITMNLAGQLKYLRARKIAKCPQAWEYLLIALRRYSRQRMGEW